MENKKEKKTSNSWVKEIAPEKPASPDRFMYFYVLFILFLGAIWFGGFFYQRKNLHQKNGSTGVAAPNTTKRKLTCNGLVVGKQYLPKKVEHRPGVSIKIDDIIIPTTNTDYTNESHMVIIKPFNGLDLLEIDSKELYSNVFEKDSVIITYDEVKDKQGIIISYDLKQIEPIRRR